MEKDPKDPCDDLKTDPVMTTACDAAETCLRSTAPFSQEVRHISADTPPCPLLTGHCALVLYGTE